MSIFGEDLTYGEWVDKYGETPIGKKTIWCRLGQHTYYLAHSNKVDRWECLQCGKDGGVFHTPEYRKLLDRYNVP